MVPLRSPGPRTGAVVVALALLVGCGDEAVNRLESATGPVRTSTSVTVPTTSSTSTSSTTTSTSTSTSTSTTTTTAPMTRDLRLGDAGTDVLALEGALAALGYWPGAVDGTFDDSTSHAVVAVQKAAGLPRDGVAGPAVRTAIDGQVLPAVRGAPGRHVEIHLDEQLLLIVGDSSIDAILDTSTGARPGTTPVGSWTVTREIDALHRSPLGLLYRPKYFVRGVAVHGYTSVPPDPASHGCVRVTYPAMDLIWDLALMPVGTPVVVS